MAAVPPTIKASHTGQRGDGSAAASASIGSLDPSPPEALSHQTPRQGSSADTRQKSGTSHLLSSDQGSQIPPSSAANASSTTTAASSTTTSVPPPPKKAPTKLSRNNVSRERKNTTERSSSAKPAGNTRLVSGTPSAGEQGRGSAGTRPKVAGAGAEAPASDSVRGRPEPSSALTESAPAVSPPAIDPLSQQIFMRTNTDHSIPPRLRNPLRPASPVAADGLALPTSDQSTKHSTPTGDATKDKKKGVSFLSRLSMRTGKKKDAASIPDTDSELSEQHRTDGTTARAFTSIIGAGGYIPHHKEPPRYIRVKAQNKKSREFNRIFLAQELEPAASSDASGGTDGVTQQGSAEAHVRNEKTPAPTAAATAGKDVTVRKTGAGRSPGAIWATEFSKDGRYLAAAGRDGVVRVWAVLSTREERRVQEEDEAAGNMNAADTGERLNAPVFRGKPVRDFFGHTGEVLDLSWSKNNFLLSSSMDKTVRLWHLSRKECLCTFKHKDFVTKLAFHPKDDRFFLAGSLDTMLRLWSIPDKAIAYSEQLPDLVTAVAFSPDGKTAIAGLLNGLCLFYETEGLKFQTQIHVRSSRGKNAKGSKITGIQTMVIPPAPIVPPLPVLQSSASSAAEVPLASPTSTTTMGVPHDHTDGEVKVLITSNDSRIRIYNLRDKSLDSKFKGHENVCSQIAASFSDDGQYVICGSEDRKGFIWNIGGPAEENKDKRPCESFDAHQDIVTTAVFAPTKSRMLLSASGDPIYDLCNPPPVTLMSVEDMELEAKGSTTALSAVNGPGEDASTQPQTPSETIGGSNTTRRHDEHPTHQPIHLSPAYIARSTHYDGNIIVTTSDTGSIKVFRQDCAFAKRRLESWETSALSRKLTAHSSGGHSIGALPLGRSASILTRTSASSAAHSRRGSLSTGASANASATIGTLQLGAGSSDRILSWRQGIEGDQRGSVAGVSNGGGGGTPTRSERSVSPSKVARGSTTNLASEARKMPYVHSSPNPNAHSATTSPTTSLFAHRTVERFGFRRRTDPEHGDEHEPEQENSAEKRESDGREPERRKDEGIGREKESVKEKEKSSDRLRDGPKENDRETTAHLAQPPTPSFSFRPIDDDADQLRLDPAGASYSFWNLNRWKGGIASLRGSVSSDTRPASDAASSAGATPTPGFTLQPVGERDETPDADRDKEKDKKQHRSQVIRRKSLSAAKASEEANNSRSTPSMSTAKHNRRRSTPPLTSTLAQTLSSVLPSILTPSSTNTSSATAHAATTPSLAARTTDQPNPDIPEPEPELDNDHRSCEEGENEVVGEARDRDRLTAPEPSREEGDRSPYGYSRGNSVVSQLSDELTSSEGEEMRCSRCGGKEFKARRIGGRQRLLCGHCGNAVEG